jgi:hypothetical protein
MKEKAKTLDVSNDETPVLREKDEEIKILWNVIKEVRKS